MGTVTDDGVLETFPVTPVGLVGIGPGGLKVLEPRPPEDGPDERVSEPLPFGRAAEPAPAAGDEAPPRATASDPPTRRTPEQSAATQIFLDIDPPDPVCLAATPRRSSRAEYAPTAVPAMENGKHGGDASLRHRAVCPQPRNRSVKLA